MQAKIVLRFTTIEMRPKLAYIYSDDLIKYCDLIPAVPGRVSQTCNNFIKLNNGISLLISYQNSIGFHGT